MEEKEWKEAKERQKLQNLKICFQARPSYDVFSSKMFKKLKHSSLPGLRGIFITSDAKETRDVKGYLQQESDVEILEVSAYFEEHWEEFTQEKLVEYEEKYDCAPVWKYIYMDRFLIHDDYDYCVKITAGYFQFWESIFQNSDVDYYYDEAVATLHTALAYIVGRYHGVKYITQMVGRGEIEATHHFFANAPFLFQMEVSQNYQDREYTGKEWEDAENFLQRYENHDIKAGGMKYVETRPRLGFSYLVSLLPLYFYMRFGRRSNNKYFYMYYRDYGFALDRWKFYFRYKRCRKYYHKADYTKKYIYMALHYQPEASTIVCAQKYEKQLFFIDSWAKSIPADTVLYVKEHYVRVGHREESFYTELRKYPNVVLIDPWENSRDLILHAQAVTTLTGTVGWEAMLLRKPVIICGRVFYENAPGVIRLEDIYQQYLPAISQWRKPERNDVIQYLCCVLSGMKKGNMYTQTEDALTEENVDLVAASLYDMLCRIQEKPEIFDCFRPEQGGF